MKQTQTVIFSADEILTLLGQEAMRRLGIKKPVHVSGYPKINRTFWSIDLDSIKIIVEE